MITKYAYLLKTITTHIAMNNTNATSTITNSHHNHKHMIATTIILFRNTTYNRCSSLFTKAQFSTLCCIIGLLFNAAIYAQETPNFPLPVDEKQFESRELVYRMSQEGDSLGYSKVSIEVKRDQIVVSMMSLSHTADKLPDKNFLRIHRSYIISLRHVSKFNQIGVVLGEKHLPIGRHYKLEFLKWTQANIV